MCSIYLEVKSHRKNVQIEREGAETVVSYLMFSPLHGKTMHHIHESLNAER